jgi:hypothetical protein
VHVLSFLRFQYFLQVTHSVVEVAEAHAIQLAMHALHIPKFVPAVASSMNPSLQ